MNQFERRSRRSYDKKAIHYDSTFDGKFTLKFQELLYQSLSLRPDDVVADIACGNGRFLRKLENKHSFRGYGVDISEKMVEQAKKLNPDMDFFVAGCDKLPFPNEAITVMTVCAAFHHFPDVEKFAAEAYRVLGTGGRLYIADVYLPAIVRALCNPFVKFSPAGDVRFYAPGEIASLFGRHGFHVTGMKIRGSVQLIRLQRNSPNHRHSCFPDLRSPSNASRTLSISSSSLFLTSFFISWGIP